MTWQTGFYGVPGVRSSRSKVHVAVNGKPLCGSVFDPRSVFQWCAAGVYGAYLECERCKAIIRARAKAGVTP